MEKIYQLMDIGQAEFTLIQTAAPIRLLKYYWEKVWEENTGSDESPYETFIKSINNEGHTVKELEIEDKIYTK